MRISHIARVEEGRGNEAALKRVFFVVAGLVLFCVAHPTGSARAQSDYSAEEYFSAQAYPHEVNGISGVQDDAVIAEAGWYAAYDSAPQSLSSCGMKAEPGETCADPEFAETAGESSFAPELVSGNGQTQEAWSSSPLWGLSFEDRDAIGRVAYAEAGNQGEEGIAAVIFTILNRVASGQFQDSIQGVIDAPNQFEPATRAGGWRNLPPLDPAQSVQFETILNLILAGWLPDLTQGALFFQNARIVAARAAAGAVSPHLVDFGGTPPVAEIGDHRFYDARAAANLAALRWRNRAEDTYAASAIESLPYESGFEDQPIAAEPEANAPAWSDLSEAPAPVQDELPPG